MVLAVISLWARPLDDHVPLSNLLDNGTLKIPREM